MTTDNHAACYAALKSRDSRFDGHFFVGVTSTGIYCRPVCRARLPRPEHCVFFQTAAQAERAGFRPCLLCRPELAPGAAPVDASSRLAYLAAKQLEENCGSIESLGELAAALGCTDRHLRRVFRREYRVSPVEYLQTCRLLLAKSLLTDTGLPVLEVAMAAGFGSLRRFNDLFQKRYRMSPTALRRLAPGSEEQIGQDVTLTLGYRPPYGWEALLAFLAPRAIPGVEAVRDGAYYRTARLFKRDGTEVCGWIRVENMSGKDALGLTVSASLLAVLPQVLARVKHLFDLNCDPDRVVETLRAMDEIRPGLCAPGTRVPGCFDSFEMSVRAILGQQITVKAAATLAGRLAQSVGRPVLTGVDGLTHVFPTAREFCGLGEPVSDKLGPLGVTSARSDAIFALAKKLENHEIRLIPGADPERAMEQLTQIPGIGAWTAEYIAMRALGWTDAFPETDCAIKKALAPRTRKEIRDLAGKWRPWRSYAAMNLWNLH